MADIFQLEKQLEQYKKEGKSLSTSKSFAKVYNQLQEAKKSSPLGSYAGGMSSIIDKAIGMSQKAVQPAVSSLEASIPEISARYGQQRQQLEAEKDPLTARYDSIINSIKGGQSTAENRQTLTTRNELGRRGITSDSGLAEQEVTNAVNPITQQYTGMIADAGFERESALRNLANLIANSYTQETADTRGVQNMIGQLLGNAGQSGISAGLNMAQMQQSAGQFQDQLGFNKQQASIQNELTKLAQQLAQQKYNQIELPLANYQLNKPYYNPSTSNTTGWE